MKVRVKQKVLTPLTIEVVFEEMIDIIEFFKAYDNYNDLDGTTLGEKVYGCLAAFVDPQEMLK